MTARTWIHNLFARKPRTIRKDRFRFRPRLEALEPRLAPATYTVQPIGDATGPVTGVSPGVFTAPTLRAAVDAANLAGGSNTITFAPAVAGQTITASANDSTHPFAFG